MDKGSKDTNQSQIEPEDLLGGQNISKKGIWTHGRQGVISEADTQVIARLMVTAEFSNASHTEPELVPQAGVWPC